MPAWLQNDAAWIAIGVSVLFIVVGVVMRRVIVQVLKAPAPKETSSHE